MPQNYEFEKTTVDGIKYVIANPKGNGEMVRMEAEWTEGDEVEGKWEEAVRAIIGEDLLGDMNLDGANGRIDKRTAVETLAAAEEDGQPVVASERQADALIEYFADQDILRLEGNKVVLLQDPGDQNLSGRAALNWAATMDACMEKIKETKENIERAKKKLEEKEEEFKSGQNDIKERMHETGQKLKSLGDSPGVPQSRAELDESERTRYDNLMEEYIHHKKMHEAHVEDVVEKTNQGKGKLARQMSMLNSTMETLEEKKKQIRSAAVREHVFPDEAIEMTENVGNIVTELAGVGNVAETVENTSEEDFAEMVENDLPNMGGLEEAEEQTEQEEHEDTSNTNFNQ
ncbi:hypothetical protein [Halorubellus litoreus]|uniref:Uncharacterized protein n=1 Tax=Halorubellus litoreus TaxID=755308 RepID=A0ABD5VNU8_9EURY